MNKEAQSEINLCVPQSCLYWQLVRACGNQPNSFVWKVECHNNIVNDDNTNNNDKQQRQHQQHKSAFFDSLGPMWYLNARPTSFMHKRIYECILTGGRQ